jgi:protein phosphatase PTC7
VHQDCSFELGRFEDIEDELFLSYYDVDPVEVLQRAYERSLAEANEQGIVGSSTALLAVLRNDELRLANVGDCCCSIIRGGEYIFRSEEQQHSFNFPVQLGTNSKDTPRKDAQPFTVKVQKDDVRDALVSSRELARIMTGPRL